MNDTAIAERETKSQGDETNVKKANSSANKRREQQKKVSVMDDLKNAFIKAIKELPEGRIPELLDMIQTFSDNAKQEPIKPLPINQDELKSAEIELYPDFKNRTKEANGLKCLEENWGHWLKEYTPNLDRDYMSQADLKKLDPKLLSRLTKQHNGTELNKYLPSINSLNKQIASSITKEQKKEFSKIQGILYRNSEP